MQKLKWQDQEIMVAQLSEQIKCGYESDEIDKNFEEHEQE